MKVKLNNGRQFNSKNGDDGVIHMGGAELVQHAIDGVSYADGTMEDLLVKVDKLAEIVGALLELLPETERIRVCGIYDLDMVA